LGADARLVLLVAVSYGGIPVARLGFWILVVPVG
jgi:hypothetical protein